MVLPTFLIVVFGLLALAGALTLLAFGSAYLRLSKTVREQARVLEREAAKAAHIGRQLNDKMLELKRCNSEFEQFTYVVSHDLQEPLRMVASYTDLLVQRYKGQFDERGEKYVSYASDGAKRMQSLVEALLAFSRIGTRGRLPEPTDLTVVARDATKTLSLAMTRAGAYVEIDSLPKVMADAAQIGQVFVNLIDNSIKFRGDRTPHIRIEAKPDGNQWIIHVADNGIGIDTKFSERVFLLFQRLHDRETYDGIGIGLTLSRKIVERHGGRIWYESQPGRGTTFFFTLPAVIQQRAAA
jgi:light-regulated signal transduction histidine kinase (bacteriophytochrome)